MKAQTTIPSQAIVHYQRRKKIFQDKNKFKQFIATNPALQKVIEGKSQPKESNIANTAYNNPDM